MTFRSIIILPLAVLTTAVATLAVTSSCRFQPKDDPGDTVAAKYFEPVDTSSAAYKAKLKARKAAAPVVDSVDIFYIGEASTHRQVQLLSYPSRRDTLTYSRTSHIKVTGNADFGHVVRVKFWVSPGGDSLVSRITEVNVKPQK